jgi:hypothetical protein
MTKLQSFINEQFNGIIWRMEVDSLSETIFVEVRNSEEKQVSFGSISLSDGKTNFKDLTTPERWFTGIEAAYDGVLLLHNYQSEMSPVHKGLIGIDPINATTLWSNYTYGFDHLSINGPVVFNSQVQPKKLFLMDVKTGRSNRLYEPVIDTDLINKVIFPQMLPLSHLKQNVGIEPYGNSVHYLEYNNFGIVSLHSFEAGNLKQHLYIINDLGIIYEDLLNADIQKLQPEAFILHQNHLIYIKNKAELKVLSL